MKKNVINDVSTRAEAAWALGEIGDKAGLKPLLKLLKDPKEEVRIEAAVALGRLGDQWGNDVIMKSLGSEDDECRLCAVYGLAYCPVPARMEVLLGILENEHWKIKLEAIKTLKKIGGSEAEELLKKAERDPHPAVRNAAAEALMKK